MGISLLLRSITEDEAREILKDPKKTGEVLKYPYMEYIEYWKSRSESNETDESDRYDADKSWDPLDYLLSNKRDAEFKLEAGKKKFYKIKLQSNNVVKMTYGKGTLAQSEKPYTTSKTETNYCSTKEEAITFVSKKLKEKLKEYQIQLEFEPRLKEEDLKTEEEETTEDVNVGEKRKKTTETKPSKKVKISKNLSDASADFMKLELEKRGLDTNGTKVDLIIRLALDISGITSGKISKKCYMLHGGITIDFEMGYGNPRLLNHEEIEEWLDCMSEVSEDELKSRYNPSLMNSKGIGPPNFYQNAEDTWDYLMIHHKGIKQFLTQAIHNKRQLLVYLS